VKGLAMQFKQYSVAFEAGQFDLPPPSTIFNVDDLAAQWMRINVFSQMSFLSMRETAIKGDYQFQICNQCGNH
jgi:hypothetical protein